MALPDWYIEQAEDYIAVLYHAHNYTPGELRESTRRQRLAEYRLLRERLSQPGELPGELPGEPPGELPGEPPGEPPSGPSGELLEEPPSSKQPMHCVLKPYDIKMMSTGYAPLGTPYGYGPKDKKASCRVSRKSIWDQILKA